MQFTLSAGRYRKGSRQPQNLQRWEISSAFNNCGHSGKDISIDRQHFAPFILFFILFFLSLLSTVPVSTPHEYGIDGVGWMDLSGFNGSPPPPPTSFLPTTAVARQEHLQRSPLAHPSSLSGLTFLGYPAGLPGFDPRSSGIHSVFYSLASKII